MLERRATLTSPDHSAAPAAAEDPLPDTSAVLGLDDRTAVPATEPASASTATAPVWAFARRVAAEHQRAHGHPISREALRTRLGVTDALAADLHHQLTTS